MILRPNQDKLDVTVSGVTFYLTHRAPSLVLCCDQLLRAHSLRLGVLFQPLRLHLCCYPLIITGLTIQMKLLFEFRLKLR